MKLICFSNNTAGALLCNLLNNNLLVDENDPISYRVSSWQHHEFKIGDTPSIQRSIDIDNWNQKINTWKNNNFWFGTHAHPSAIPDLSIFDEVIAITTTSRTSKLYRWLRYYHGWFKSVHPNWKETNDLEKIDKIRCLAYNVFDEFEPHSNCKNIEFEDIVSGKFIQDTNLNLNYFNEWKKRNSWLYSDNNNMWAIQRFNEAEYELTTKTPYRYI